MREMELGQSRVGAISYFFNFEAERFIWAVGDPKDQLLLTKFFDQTAYINKNPDLRSSKSLGGLNVAVCA